MIRLLRFLRGYVRFEVIGRFPERFINIALRAGIALWDTTPAGDVIRSCMYMSDYLRCRIPARRSRCRLRIIRRYGLPVILHRHRDRVGVAVGMGVFAAVVVVMSMFLWSMEIHGLDRISEYEVREALTSEGVHIGAFLPSLDPMTASRRVMLRLPDIGWMAINISGSHADVEIKEESPAPAVEDTAIPANVKAAADGVIVRMNVLQGEGLTGVGSGVIEGQLLVSGVITDKLGGVSLVRSDARIIARTHHTAVFSIPVHSEVLFPTGERTRRMRVSVLGAEIPLTASGVDSSRFALRRRRESLVCAGVIMPLSCLHESVNAMEYRSVKRDDNSAKELLKIRSLLYECFALHRCTVEERRFSMRREDGTVFLTADYTCLEDIAAVQEIGTDENTVTEHIPSPTTAEEP